MSVAEIVGMEGEIITMQDIFMFEREGVDAEGNVLGQFAPSGIRPTFAERLKQYGNDLPETLFMRTRGGSGGRW